MMPFAAMRLRQAPWSPLRLPSIYAAYDASDPSTLWQDAARTVPVTAHGDPVWTIDDITGGGHHLFTGSATSRGFWQAGLGVLTDGADDYYRESDTSMQSLTLPLYLAVAFKKAAAPVGRSIFALRRKSSGTDYLMLLDRNVAGSSTAEAGADHRIGADRAFASSSGSAWPVGTSAVSETLGIAGATQVQVNNNAPVSAANTFTLSSQWLDAKVEIANGAFGNASDAGIWSRGIVCRADPGEMRVQARLWLAAPLGVTL